MSFYTVKFSPNQKLPEGYTVEWWPSDEMYRWVLEADRSPDGLPETYSVEFCDRFAARRSAWAHYRKSTKQH